MLRAPSGTNWEFEGFKVLTEMRLLLSEATPVPLTSKAFDTLVLLIANRDRVVTKDELLRSVWPDVAVEEGNLTQQIFLLRKALGESAQRALHRHSSGSRVPLYGTRDGDRGRPCHPRGRAARRGSAVDRMESPLEVHRWRPHRVRYPRSSGDGAWLDLDAGQGKPAAGLDERSQHKSHGKRQGHVWRHLSRRPVRRLCRERWR